MKSIVYSKKRNIRKTNRKTNIKKSFRNRFKKNKKSRRLKKKHYGGAAAIFNQGAAGGDILNQAAAIFNHAAAATGAGAGAATGSATGAAAGAAAIFNYGVSSNRLVVPENCILITFGNIGEPNKIYSKSFLKFVKMFSTNNHMLRKPLDHIQDLKTEFGPTLHFHYSDYYGRKPDEDSIETNFPTPKKYTDIGYSNNILYDKYYDSLFRLINLVRDSLRIKILKKIKDISKHQEEIALYPPNEIWRNYEQTYFTLFYPKFNEGITFSKDINNMYKVEKRVDTTFKGILKLLFNNDTPKVNALIKEFETFLKYILDNITPKSKTDTKIELSKNTEYTKLQERLGQLDNRKMILFSNNDIMDLETYIDSFLFSIEDLITDRLINKIIEQLDTFTIYKTGLRKLGENLIVSNDIKTELTFKQINQIFDGCNMNETLKKKYSFKVNEKERRKKLSSSIPIYKLKQILSKDSNHNRVKQSELFESHPGIYYNFTCRVPCDPKNTQQEHTFIERAYSNNADRILSSLSQETQSSPEELNVYTFFSHSCNYII